MNHIRILVIFSAMCTVYSNPNSAGLNPQHVDTDLPPDVQVVMRALVRKVESLANELDILKAKQLRDNAKLENRFGHLEARLGEEVAALLKTNQRAHNKKHKEMVEPTAKHPTTEKNLKEKTEVKGTTKLNDTSNLEERVSILELGLTAVADDLDELEESQVKHLSSYILFRNFLN